MGKARLKSLSVKVVYSVVAVVGVIVGAGCCPQARTMSKQDKAASKKCFIQNTYTAASTEDGFSRLLMKVDIAAPIPAHTAKGVKRNQPM